MDVVATFRPILKEHLELCFVVGHTRKLNDLPIGAVVPLQCTFSERRKQPLVLGCFDRKLELEAGVLAAPFSAVFDVARSAVLVEVDAEKLVLIESCFKRGSIDAWLDLQDQIRKRLAEAFGDLRI